jgi:hypothetical protein
MNCRRSRCDLAPESAVPIDGFPPLSQIVHEIATTLNVILAVAAAASLALKMSGNGG